MIRPRDLMEPEETVGNLWHDWTTRGAAAPAGAGVTFDVMRPSAAALFRALGGAAAVQHHVAIFGEGHVGHRADRFGKT